MDASTGTALVLLGILALIFIGGIASSAWDRAVDGAEPAAQAKLPAWVDLDFRSKCKRKPAPGSNAVPCLLCAGPCWGDMVDTAYEAGRKRGADASTGEFGWVIEHGASLVCSPTYFAGLNWEFSNGKWSSHNLDAIRFARKIDAERIAAFMPRMKLSIPPHRICEHGWIDWPATKEAE